MYSQPVTEQEEQRLTRLGLMGLIAALVLGAAILLAVAGPPRAPESVPRWETVVAALRGSDVPLYAVAYLLTMAAWGIWLWIVASLLLSLIVRSAEALGHGAGWVRWLRVMSDQVTLPAVRRLVDGALVATMVVNLARPGVAAGEAAPMPAATTITLAPPPDNASLSPAPLGEAAPSPTALTLPSEAPRETEHGARQREHTVVAYTVQRGDNLWEIAQRFYGTGFEYPRLVNANAGRIMAGGQRFTHAGVIQPGWVLRVPLPSRALEAVEDQPVYVVEAGDTLEGIAARLLGQEEAWPQLFLANRGIARLEDGRILTNPSLIWPGLRLRLPLPVSRLLVTELPPAVEPAHDRAARPVPAPASVASPTLLEAFGRTPKAIEGAEPSATPPVLSAPATPSAGLAPPLALLPPLPTGEHSEATDLDRPHQPTSVPTPADAPTEQRSGPPAPESPVEPEAHESTGTPLSYGAAGLAVAVAAAGAGLLARRGVRRRLSEPPVPAAEPLVPAGSDFADVEFSHAYAQRLHSGEPEAATLVAERVLRLLRERGLHHVAVVAARQRRTAAGLTLALTLRAERADQVQLLDLASAIGIRLGGAGEAWLTSDQDVMLHLSGLKLLGLMTTPPWLEAKPAPAATPTWLLPLGILPTGEKLYANWLELGHVLVAGLPGSGTHVVLTSIVTALAARCSPDTLRLWTIAGRHVLPDQLRALPHHHGSFIDPADEGGLHSTLQALRAELERRVQAPVAPETGARVPAAGQPHLVVVVDGLEALPDDGTTLEMVGSLGPAHGVHLLAATTDQGSLSDGVLDHFGTRFVLQTLDEAHSIQLLGQPDAADLANGDLFLRLNGRMPMRARGFRVSTDHIAQLVQLMMPAPGTLGTSRAPDAFSTPHTLDTFSISETPSTRQPATAATTTGATGPTAPDRPPSAQTTSPPPSTLDLAGESASAEERHDHWPGPSPAIAPSARTVQEPDAALCETHHTNASSASTALAVKAEINALPAPQASLLQITCFGGFMVSSGDRRISPAGDDYSHFKSWEVLTFLAAHPDGAVSKDTLLAAIWPEVDLERATNRLRVTMARLRAVLTRQVPGLTASVVRAERNGTCHLDTRVVSSDVHRFLALTRNTTHLPPSDAKLALQEARALYRGDLLAGPDVPFNEWVHAREDSGLSLQERYREVYYRATQQLAQLFYREGQAALAVPLYKTLLKAEPTLEDIVQELFRCYEQLQDLPSLIREERSLRQALREAYGDADNPHEEPEAFQPDVETVALFREIHAKLRASGTAEATRETDADVSRAK